MDADYLTAGQVATLVGCSRVTVYRAAVAGEFDGAFRSANEWLIPRQSAVAWGDAYRTRNANRQARAMIASVAGADIADAVVPGNRRRGRKARG